MPQPGINFVSLLGVLLMSMLVAGPSLADPPVSVQVTGTESAAYGYDAAALAPPSRAGRQGRPAGTNPAPPPSNAQHQSADDGRTGFWVVGIIINLAVLTLFIAWALREWRRSGK